MWKKIFGAIILGGFAYAGYDYYRAGFHTAPAHQPGDFLLSYSNGFRAVMRGIDDEKASRTYLGQAIWFDTEQRFRLAAHGADGQACFA